MKVQIAIPTALLTLVAASCGSTRTEMRPVSQSSQPVAQAAPAAPASAKPAVATTAAAAPAPTRSLVAPGAAGFVNSDVDDNGNLVLEVELDHLPPPMDLDPMLTTYVVWIRPVSGGGFQNVGQLVIDNNRHGELTTTTPYGMVEVIVTGEASATPAEPSRFTVLQGSASKK